jgi:dihydropteroate synthase
MQVKDTLFYKKKTMVCNGRLLTFETPKVMAIVNATPDSFYDGGHHNTSEGLEKRILQCMEEKADIIDIGAYSSRPGAEHISEAEEVERLNMALEITRKIAPEAIVSIDTFRSGVAREMIKRFGVNIINDISGGQLDPDMYEVVAHYGLPYVLMHMKGTPQKMQENPTYDDVFTEVMTFFAYKTDQLYSLGIKDVVIDPGFGFGKSMEHNYELMKQLQDFVPLECPLMVGISRKSMVYKKFGLTASEALNGTTALHMASLMKGADIIRAHDVKEARQAIALYKAMT